MNICEEKHEEIVFQVRECPLCTAIKDIENLEKERERDIENARELLESQ